MKPRAEIQKAYRKRRAKNGFTDMRITIPVDLPKTDKQKIRDYARKVIKRNLTT